MLVVELVEGSLGGKPFPAAAAQEVDGPIAFWPELWEGPEEMPSRFKEIVRASYINPENKNSPRL